MGSPPRIMIFLAPKIPQAWIMTSQSFHGSAHFRKLSGNYLLHNNRHNGNYNYANKFYFHREKPVVSYGSFYFLFGEFRSINAILATIHLFSL